MMLYTLYKMGRNYEYNSGGSQCGKTTKMAKDVLEYSKMTDNKKYIFVITFTNYACNKIKEELKKRHDSSKD